MWDITIADLLGNYAFPAIIALIMIKENKDLRSEHKEETEKLTTAIQNNTEALIVIREHMKGDEK